MPDIHHAIYIPAPKGINTKKEFNAITFNQGGQAMETQFKWGDKARDGQTPEQAIREQKQGYTQIAGNFKSASDILERMRSKANDRRGSGYSAESIIYQSLKGGALKNLINKGETVLYIDSHGDSLNMGFRPYGLSAEGMARLMQHEQIPPNVKMIKLFACFSGEEADTDRGARTGDIFAQQFSAWMSTFGYRGIKVYGYLGPVSVTPNGQRKSQPDESNARKVRAKDGRREFIDGRMTQEAKELLP
jgi:hypothetical protein